MRERLEPTLEKLEGGGRPAELFVRKTGTEEEGNTADVRTADSAPAWRARRFSANSR